MTSGQVKAGTTDDNGETTTLYTTDKPTDKSISQTNLAEEKAEEKTTATTNQQTVAVTPDKPSTDKPYYDGKQVVDTSFYNNPQGTGSDLLENKNHDGKYTIYFTARDKSGKEYTSSYATGNAGIPHVYLNSLLDKDKGAYDPDTLALHFYYESDSNDDQNINYSIKLPSYTNAFKVGNPEATIIPDSSRKNQVSITSAKNNNYDLSKITTTLDNAAASQGDWSRMYFIPVTLIVKGNDRINLSIPYKLVDTNANTKTDDYNDFDILENNQQTGKLIVRTSSYKPLVDADALPAIRTNAGNNNYQYVPDLDSKLSSPETEIVQNDFLNYYFDNPINGALPVDQSTVSTVVGDYSYTYLKLADYEKYLTQHGYTVAFANGKPMDHYFYTLSKSGATLTNPDGSAVDKDGFYFEVVPVILLNQDQTYTTKTAPKAWNPSELVKTVADPTNYQVWDSKSDSAIRRDNSQAQLTAGDFKVTVTRNGQVVNPDKNGNYDLSQAGVYTVTYARDFNGTVISNSGTITVNPVTDNGSNDKGSDKSGSNETSTTTEPTDQPQPATNDNVPTEVEKLTPATKDDQANKNNAKNDETTTETQHLMLRHHDKQTKPVTVVAKTRQSKTNNANEGTVKALADAKANNQVAHAQSLPQTGEEHGISLSIAGLIAILFGLPGFSIIDKNDKKEAN